MTVVSHARDRDQKSLGTSIPRFDVLTNGSKKILFLVFKTRKIARLLVFTLNRNESKINERVDLFNSKFYFFKFLSKTTF